MKLLRGVLYLGINVQYRQVLKPSFPVFVVSGLIILTDAYGKGY
jgi:hypothetical protein